MRAAVLALVMLAAALPARAAMPGMDTAPAGMGPSDRYWSLDGWLDSHPRERARLRALRRRVRGPARAPDNMHQAPVRLAFVYPTAGLTDYWQRNVTAVKKRLGELGLPYRLQVYTYGPAPDGRHGRRAIEQARQVERALAREPDYLLLTVTSSAQRRTVERLLARERPRIILQNLTTPVRAWGETQPFLYVGFNHGRGSRLLAEAMRRRHGGRTGFVVLETQGDAISRWRSRAFVEPMKNAGNTVLKGRYQTRGNRLTGRRAARDALRRHDALDVIFASRTATALGAADAVERAGRDGVTVNGWGGGPAELRALRQGRLDLTLMRMNDDAGVAVAEAIALARAGEAGAVPTVYSGDFAIITRDTPAEVVALQARKAFRYSGNRAP